MKISIISIFFLFIILNLITPITIIDGRIEKGLQITLLTIKFDKSDAIFTVNYHFDQLSKFYLLMFGSKSIEPKVKSLFSNFNYEIIKIDQDEAILKVKNISRQDNGYYLHESKKFGATIDKVYIYSPDSVQPREYDNLNSTPYFFYKKK